MQKVIMVRDSPSEEEYRKREQSLLDTTKDLQIRPGQVTKPVSFRDYYERNWKSCAFRWIFAYRKNLPTLGTNDTQASESTFRAIKHYCSVEFGSRMPTLTELVRILPKILDRRLSEREDISNHRRLLFHDPENKHVDKALELASWELNEGGYRLFYQELKAALFKQKNMSLDDNIITEKYIGKKTKSYVGKYTTDGVKCNCSWYQSRLLCRHPFFFRMEKNMPLFDINMFHPSFKVRSDSNEAVEDEAATAINESVDMFDQSGNINSRLGSPGMEYLLAEEQEATKKLKKNVKFNRAFDVAKVAAEYTSMYSTEQFNKNLETFKQFTELLRTGLPKEVVEVINKCFEAKDDAPDEKSKKDAKKPSKTTIKTCTSSKSFTSEVCQEHKHLIPEHLGVYVIPGDGSCLFGALAAHIYQDESQVMNLRRLCHYYMVENWWYYAQFFALPFIETVGVGAESYSVHINNYDDLKSFFLSNNSLKCFNNSSIDFAVVANMFNMNIGVFTYGLGNLPPRWSWVYPDPLFIPSSNTYDFIPDALLYHRDNVHYELLVPKSSSLAKNGNVSSRLTKILQEPMEEEDVLDPVIDNNHDTDDEVSVVNFTEFDIVNAPVEYIVNAPIVTASQADIQGDPRTFISPLVFKQCPRGPGRPKRKREGAPNSKATKRARENNNDDEIGKEPNENVEQPPPRKRGRPKGSKNKTKTVVEPAKKDDLKTRAEKAADPNNEPFFDSGDICEICEFPFNHPLKINKPKMKCKQCTKTVHIPCYLKNGCTCTWV